jgi:DNA-binding CsgD family transcriptional regulator
MPVLLHGAGMDTEAARWVQEAAAAGFDVLRTDPLRLAALAFAAESCVLAEDAVTGEVLFEELAPHAGQHIVIADGIGVMGPVEYYLGRLAGLCGRKAEALSFIRRAEEMAEHGGLLPMVVRCRLERARLGDDHAESLAVAALKLAERLGMASLAIEAAAELELLRQAPASLPAGLTAREAEVLALMAQGKTNAQIAETLVLSRHTVVRHLANAYGKIGATNRAEATSFVTRNGLG